MNLYGRPDVIPTLKWLGLRWAEQVVKMEERELFLGWNMNLIGRLKRHCLDYIGIPDSGENMSEIDYK